MAKYTEVFSGKLDWAMPFQRTGAWPLDRSSMFESYADALAYARQDLTDKRKLGANSYVGQLIVVYGNDAGIQDKDTGEVKYTQEVAGYIITAVGQSASLMKLAQTTSTGDFGKDITALNTAVGALDGRIKALEEKPDVVDTNTKYTFAEATTTEGAILITNLDDNSTQEVQVKGWATLKALATGRTQAYVYANKDASDYLTDIKTPNKYKRGDIIYFTDLNIPDEWVTSVLQTADSEGCYYTFSELETEHPDLTQYLTINSAAQTYATKIEVNAKANQSDLTALQTTVTNNKTDTDTSIQTIEGKLGTVKTNSEGAVIPLQTQIDNIDVTSQITQEIDKLNVNNVGGSNQYIKSIKQVNGKIEAVAEALPDYTDTYDAKGSADQALKDAKAYVDSEIGDIGENTVKSYVDEAVTNASSAHTELASRVKVLEDAKYGDSISALQTQVGTNTSEIGTLKSGLETTAAVATKARDDVSALGTKVGTIETAVGKNTSDISTLTTNLENAKTELNTAIAGRVKKIQIGGVDQTMSADGTVNITSVSTDLLTQGSKILVFDCLNASLTDNQ